MKIGQYFLRLAAALLIWLFLDCGIAAALPEHMLSPAIMINSQTFVQNMSSISEQPFIAPWAPLTDRIKHSRRVFYEQNNNNQEFSLWPKFFLKNVLSLGTDNLKVVMRELIQWMDSDSFKQLDDIQRLGHIEDMARKLTPFERILFYEGVYFVEPDGSDLGFNINTKQDWGVLYFYKKTFFAHGAVHSGKASQELTFGDDLARRDLPKIKHVHFYAYMKRLVDVYIENPEKFLIIPNDQLLTLATYTDQNFLAQSLKFYLSKVGGFMPEYEAPDGILRELQLEYLSQLKNGLRISFKDAVKIVECFGLNRDIPAEEEEYLSQAYKQNHLSREISRPRDISKIEMDVNIWNIYFVGKNGEQELFLEDYELIALPIYKQLMSDIETFKFNYNNSELEKIEIALLRKNEGALPFFKGDTFRIVLKELLLNAIRAVRESKEGKGKVIVTAEIKGDEFIISIIDNGKKLETEVDPEAFGERFALQSSGWNFNGNGWDYIGPRKNVAEGEMIKLFDEGFTTKKNEWGLNGYGLYYSRLFVEQVLGVDYPTDKKPQLRVTDNSYSSQPGTLKTFQIILPLQINKNPELKTFEKNSSDKIQEYCFIDRAI